VNATHNYWGTSNQTAISNSIYDNKDKPNLGIVNFVPYLTAPNTQAMPNQNDSVTIPTASPSPTPLITTVTLITILVVAVLAVVVSLLVNRRLRKSPNLNQSKPFPEQAPRVTS
jgi:hypothetical protein